MTKIGIIGAMELEVEQLKKEMAVESVIKKAGMDFFEGTLSDVPVVIVRSGIGKVNAALCVQILADVFQVSHVINTGVAGSLNAKLDIGDLGKAKQEVLFEAVEMDFEKDLLYSITFADSSVRIRKVRIPVFTIGLNEKLDDSTYTVLEDHAVPAETFLFLGSYTKYGEFLDGQDGYWYGFSNEGNSSGSARVLWVRVSKADYSVTEGEWTLSNARLMAVGERDMTGSYPERKCRCCMRNGYLYVPAYDKKGIYKINVANTADVSLIAFGFTSKMKPLCESGTCELFLTLVGDLIVGGDFQVTAEDAVIHTQGSARLGSAATPLFQYKQFLVGWGGSYGNEYRHMYLLMPYLATINNLSSAVVKDANKTMKITYTLTEVESGEG